MHLKIELTDEQAELLDSKARELGVQPDRLARAWLVDLLTQPDEQFERVAKQVVENNRDLYKRLS